MDARKKARREAAGFRFGDAGDFLGLSDAERAVVEIRVSLARRLREMRLEAHLTQAAFAKQLHSSQSRVAKMEGGDPTVTIDLLIQALLAVGADRRDVAKALAGAT